MSDVRIKDYHYQQSDKEHENANNEELRKIIVQLRAEIIDLEKRLKAQEEKE